MAAAVGPAGGRAAARRPAAKRRVEECLQPSSASPVRPAVDASVPHAFRGVRVRGRAGASPSPPAQPLRAVSAAATASAAAPAPALASAAGAALVMPARAPVHSPARPTPPSRVVAPSPPVLVVKPSPTPPDHSDTDRGTGGTGRTTPSSSAVQQEVASDGSAVVASPTPPMGAGAVAGIGEPNVPHVFRLTWATSLDPLPQLRSGAGLLQQGLPHPEVRKHPASPKRAKGVGTSPMTDASASPQPDDPAAQTRRRPSVLEPQGAPAAASAPPASAPITPSRRRGSGNGVRNAAGMPVFPGVASAGVPASAGGAGAAGAAPGLDQDTAAPTAAAAAAAAVAAATAAAAANAGQPNASPTPTVLPWRAAEAARTAPAPRPDGAAMSPLDRPLQPPPAPASMLAVYGQVPSSELVQLVKDRYGESSGLFVEFQATLAALKAGSMTPMDVITKMCALFPDDEAVMSVFKGFLPFAWHSVLEKEHLRITNARLRGDPATIQTMAIPVRIPWPRFLFYCPGTHA